MAGNKAAGLLKILECKDVVYFLHFMLDVLKVLTAVSTSFQRTEATMGDVLTEIETARESLDNMKEQ